VLEPEDLPAGGFDAEAGEEVLTEQFLAVCGDTVRWIDRLGVIPTAVWVDGVRLSAAQYLAGLAICIQYAYWEGELYETMFLPAYDPPQAWAPAGALGSGREWVDIAGDEDDEWLGASLPPAGSTLAEADLPSEDWQWGQYEDEGEPLAPLSLPPGIAAAPRGIPEIVLYPEPGATVGGVVDLVVSYMGPEERFVILDIDGRSRIIKNFPPYGHRWDTSELKPGTHTVRVQILGEADILLIDQVSAFEVVPAGAVSSGRRLVDDL
jgi:hypothetical protein